jgi:hypothetical protein
MLIPAQVIPFLSDEDPVLRNHAVRYFQDAANPSPLTAEHCWAAIDARGLNSRSSLGLIRLLKDVEQTDASTTRLLAALDNAADPRVLRPALDDALETLAFEQLARHRDAILARTDLNPRTRKHLDERLWLADQPPDSIWEQLLRHADASRGRYWNEIDHRVGRSLVEALARHDPARAAERALAVLDDPASVNDPREIFAIDLLAQLRHRPALERLTTRFVECDDEDDVLHEALMKAIPLVGGVDAVELLEPLFPEQNRTFQIYACGALERIKHPAAEAALLRLLDDPRIDDEARDIVADAVFSLCTTDGLPRLRELVAVQRDYDDTTYDLDSDLVACALMSGYQFPELPAMREEVLAREIEFQRELESSNSGQSRTLWIGDETGEDFDDYDYGPDLPPQLDDRGSRVVAPIHNAAPKVGRNDPCPCGSGKKYKRCCLDKE